ncbi:MAG: S8 family serine peptidase [Thermoplasmata archaeon]|nr:S8 family serine peptidase [Thermoplasmata archaeon]
MSRPRWMVPASLILLALLALPGISVGVSTGIAPSAITPLVAHGQSPALPAALSAPWAVRTGYVSGVHPDATSTGPAQGNLSVSITLWPRDLSMYLPRAADSPKLSAAEFAARYSPTTSEYQSVISYFEGYGLSIQHTWPDRLSLTVSGPASVVGDAFGTTLARATVAGLPVLFPRTVPVVPAALATEISAVSGLSSGFAHFSIPLEPVASSLLARDHLTSAVGTTTTQVTPSGAHGAYGLDALYNLSGTFHGATSQNIALLLWGDGYAPSDLTTFFQKYYPSEYPVVPTIHPYPIDGAPQPSATAVNDPSGGPQELTLDLEWAGSMAPGASLDAVYAPDGPAPSYSPNDTPMEDALAFAINSIPGVSVISMSFGLPESQDMSFQAAYSTLFAAAATRGITLFGASGDDGGSALSRNACTPTPEVEFPASSPNVVAVGGTQPTLNVSLGGQITGIATQPAWNRSGGGLSVDYSAASWQLVGSAKTVIGSGGRGVPDVSGPAADNMIYFNGRVGQLAGTSFATPMWAGLVAEFDAVRGSSFGFVTPRLYAVAASEEAGGSTHAFSDVTAGTSCLYPAQGGWDEVTGWGTPRALLLYASLTSTFVDLSVTPSPASIFPGGSTTVTVTVLNGTNGVPLAGLPVTLTFAASGGYTGPCSGSFGNATVVSGTSGTAQVSFSVPLCFFGSQAQVSALLLSNGYFGQAAATVSVSLLSGSGFLSLISEFPYNVIFFTLVVVLAVLVGLLLSRRGRRRRRSPSSVPPVGAGGPAYSSPDWAPLPPGNLPAQTTPAVSGPAAPLSFPRVSTSPETLSATAPAWLPAPAPSTAPRPGVSAGPLIPAAPPEWTPPPMPKAVSCPACGGTNPAFSLSCPKCGLARP